MKKILAVLATFIVSTTGLLWSESFVQGGIGFASNIIQINEHHSAEIKLDGFYAGYKGYHTLQIMDASVDDDTTVETTGYDIYIPTLFLGFHADKFYFTVGGELNRVLWIKYNSNLKLPIAYPTISIGWDARLWQSYPHNLILNMDLSWFFCDLGDAYDNWESSTWMFIPKFSIGVKYRLNFGQDE